MNNGYLIYQAERTKSSTEQRAIDRGTGEFAAAFSRRRRRLLPMLPARPVLSRMRRGISGRVHLAGGRRRPTGRQRRGLARG